MHLMMMMPGPATSCCATAIAADTARAQLRDALLAQLRSASSSSCAAPPPTWDPPFASSNTLDDDERCPPPSPPSKKLLVGDTHTLLASLRTFTTLCHTITAAVQAQDPPQLGPPALLPLPPQLRWLAALCTPITSVPMDLQRTLDCVSLHYYSSSSRAITAPRPAPSCPSSSFADLSEHEQRAAAFEAARDLPWFDRNLTAFYAGPAVTYEYELRIAHSIMRLLPPPHPTKGRAAATAAYDAFLQQHLPDWRARSGALHVLSVLAANMPSLESDWNFPAVADLEPEADPSRQAFEFCLHTLPIARSYDAAARALSKLSAHPPPPSVSALIDHACALMHVTRAHLTRCNHPPPVTPSLLQQLGTPQLDPDAIPRLWTGMKAFLETNVHPSLLKGPIWCV